MDLPLPCGYFFKQQDLNLRPEPQGHGSFRLAVWNLVEAAGAGVEDTDSEACFAVSMIIDGGCPFLR